MKRVVVGYLSGDMVHADFASSLSVMCLWSTIHCHQDFRIAGILNHKCSDIDVGRNRLVQEVRSLKPQPTHLLFVDSDMVFPANMLQRLLAHDEAIVGIDASTRRPPYRSIARNEGQGWILGCGVMLIELDVFNRFPFPWFEGKYNGDGTHLSEDQVFCKRAHAAGIRVACDLEVSKEVGHIGQMAFYLGMLNKG